MRRCIQPEGYAIAPDGRRYLTKRVHSKELGLDVPFYLQQLADEVIE